MDPSTAWAYGPWICASCKKASAKCYRCTECGADLARTSAPGVGPRSEASWGGPLPEGWQE